MDEVPMKADRKKGSGKTPGQMKQTYFWPIYGAEDEVAFTWSSSHAMQHAKTQLAEFQGVLLTDGYAAYKRAVAQLNTLQVGITHAHCWAHARRPFENALAMAPQAAARIVSAPSRLASRVFLMAPT